MLASEYDGHVLMKLFSSDVISIEKTGENFRLIYDVKGRFTVHRITNEEAKVRLLNYLSEVIYGTVFYVRLASEYVI